MVHMGLAALMCTASVAAVYAFACCATRPPQRLYRRGLAAGALLGFILRAACRSSGDWATRVVADVQPASPPPWRACPDRGRRALPAPGRSRSRTRPVPALHVRPRTLGGRRRWTHRAAGPAPRRPVVALVLPMMAGIWHPLIAWPPGRCGSTCATAGRWPPAGPSCRCGVAAPRRAAGAVAPHGPCCRSCWPWWSRGRRPFRRAAGRLDRHRVGRQPWIV